MKSQQTSVLWKSLVFAITPRVLPEPLNQFGGVQLAGPVLQAAIGVEKLAGRVREIFRLSHISQPGRCDARRHAGKKIAFQRVGVVARVMQQHGGRHNHADALRSGVRQLSHLRHHNPNEINDLTR